MGSGARSLTRGDVDAGVLLLRHVDVDDDLAVGQAHFHHAVRQRCVHQQAAGVPGAEGQADGERVAVALARQLQEGRGVEEDREGARLGAGEGQVPLRGGHTETEGNRGHRGVMEG